MRDVDEASQGPERLRSRTGEALPQACTELLSTAGPIRLDMTLPAHRAVLRRMLRWANSSAPRDITRAFRNTRRQDGKSLRLKDQRLQDSTQWHGTSAALRGVRWD